MARIKILCAECLEELENCTCKCFECQDRPYQECICVKPTLLNKILFWLLGIK